MRISTQLTTVTAMSTPPHMTVDEFAARMVMNPRTVRKRIHDNQLKAVNVGTVRKPEYRISEAELTRWVAANEVREVA